MADLRVPVGVSEIAQDARRVEAAGLGAVRAQGLPRSGQGVAPIDATTVEIMRGLFSEQGSVSFDEAVDALKSHAYRLGPGKRLWRLTEITRWAEREGRTLRIDGD